MRTRIAFGAAGVALLGFGVFRLLTQVDTHSLVRIAVWLVAALVLHDGVLSPVLGALGLVAGVVPPRARRYVQGAFTAAALVTAVAVPFVHRSAFHQPAQKALLRQDYAANLGILVGVVLGATVLLYAARVVRDRRSSVTNTRPSQDHSSDTA